MYGVRDEVAPGFLQGTRPPYHKNLLPSEIIEGKRGPFAGAKGTVMEILGYPQDMMEKMKKCAKVVQRSWRWLQWHATGFLSNQLILSYMQG
jgi:hypothetical protein